MELVGALSGAKEAVKSVRVLGKHAAKKGIKSTMKLSAKMMKCRAIGTAKTTVSKLKQIGKSGAKTLKIFGKSLKRNARFKKFRIRFEKGRFFLEGKINPWGFISEWEIETLRRC